MVRRTAHGGEAGVGVGLAPASWPIACETRAAATEAKVSTLDSCIGVVVIVVIVVVGGIGRTAS